MAPLIIDKILQPIFSWSRESWDNYHSANWTSTDSYQEVTDDFLSIPATKGVFIQNYGANSCTVKDNRTGAEFTLPSGTMIDFPMQYFSISIKSTTPGSATTLYIQYRE